MVIYDQKHCRNYTTQFARSWGGENLGIITTDGDRLLFSMCNKIHISSKLKNVCVYAYNVLSITPAA